MKLCAIYNVWDDWDILKYSVENILPLVDGVIIVYSHTSNYGETSDGGTEVFWMDKQKPIDLVQFEPTSGMLPASNETDKRNCGLVYAKKLGYTHFLMMDADEFYEPIPFLKEKERFERNPSLQGLVCASQVYFKSPKLTIGLDTTRVTFIHRITPTLKFEFNRRFPYAWEGLSIRIDPTRQLNINSGVEWSDIVMAHMSWVRSDYEKKIRNSTARANLEKSTIREDLLSAKEGYFCKFYQKPLIRASVDFNIPEFNVHESICQPLAASNRTPSNDL